MVNKPVVKKSAVPRTEVEGIPICSECEYADMKGEVPYCDHPAVKREYDPVTGQQQSSCLEERTFAPTEGAVRGIPANRRVCGHLGLCFEKRE